MTKKIDEPQFLRDFIEGKLYAEIADKHKFTIGAVAYRVKKLGLKRSGQKGQKSESFSKEEIGIMKIMLDTRRGREQLIDIFRGK